ncbi:SecY-interacting protein [Ningiella sp. W23]|uniref:SecY-interacting protein n=1 Tax=Ningiella sp. W23 TaxID=3023715 RepID=UPI003756C814
MNDLSATFTQFVMDYIEQSTSENKGLITEYDSQWLSPCLQNLSTGQNNGDEVNWLPHKRNDSANLNNIADALEMDIPQSLSDYFCTYYSLDFNAEHPRGKIALLQAFNQADFERLQKNLIAHVLMKRRLKQTETLFFAVTDEDDFIISVEPNSENVVLEQVGKPKLEIISDNLVTFIGELKPLPQLVML